MRMRLEETAFFEELGQRIAALSNERGLLQVQLAETLCYSKQQLLSVQNGRRRMPVSAQPKLSKVRVVPGDELLGTGEDRPAKRGPNPKLRRQPEQLSQLPRSQQRFVSQILDTVLQQAEQ